MNRHFYLSLLGVLVAPLHGLAQVPSLPEPEVPTAPFVARAPDFFAWSIDVAQKKEVAAPTPTPIPVAGSDGRTIPIPPSKKVLKRSVVTKTGTTIRDVRHYTDGTQTENWWIHGKILRQNPEGGYINIVDPQIDQAAPQFNSSDFEAFGWIDFAYFAGSETKRGSRCFVYQWKDRMPTEADFSKITDYRAKSDLFLKFRGKPTLPTRAWIDKATKLPVASEDDDATYTYTYLKPPTESLVLPAIFAKDWERYQTTTQDWKKHTMPKQR